MAMGIKVPFISRGPMQRLLDPPAGSVLYYPMFPDYPSSTLTDYSGNGNTGTITGATWTSLPSGLWCLLFDGTGDRVGLGTDPSLDLTTFTLEVWVKANADVTDYRTILGKDIGATSSRNFWLAYLKTTGYLVFRISVGGAGKECNSTTAINDNIWHRVAAKYDGSNMYLRLDKTQIATLEVSGNANTPDVIAYWGAANDNPTKRYLKGYSALLSITSGAVNDSVLDQHFDQERGFFNV